MISQQHTNGKIRLSLLISGMVLFFCAIFAVVVRMLPPAPVYYCPVGETDLLLLDRESNECRSLLLQRAEGYLNFIRSFHSPVLQENALQTVASGLARWGIGFHLPVAGQNGVNSREESAPEQGTSTENVLLIASLAGAEDDSAIFNALTFLDSIDQATCSDGEYLAAADFCTYNGKKVENFSASLSGNPLNQICYCSAAKLIRFSPGEIRREKAMTALCFLAVMMLLTSTFGIFVPGIGTDFCCLARTSLIAWQRYLEKLENVLSAFNRPAFFILSDPGRADDRVLPLDGLPPELVRIRLLC